MRSHMHVERVYLLELNDGKKEVLWPINKSDEKKTKKRETMKRMITLARIGFDDDSNLYWE